MKTPRAVMLRVALSTAMLMSTGIALAQGTAPSNAPQVGERIAAPSAADEAFTTRLRHLESELRCLVCQNQTLADSNASLAEDLRREVRALAVAGKDDAEIRAYLTSRYGDFVLYSPPVKRTTWLLWFGPFVLLAAGAFAWWRIARRRTVVEPANITADADALRRGLGKLDGA